MADNTFPQVISLNNNTNALANPIFVKLTDGTNGSIIDAGGNLKSILSANSGVNIGSVDVLSLIPGVGALNLGKAVNSIAGATDTGVGVLAIRDDVLTALTPIDGDYVGLRTDANGALWVNTVGGGGGGAEVVLDDSIFTVGVSSVSGIGMLADETAPDSVNEGDIGIPRMTLDRKQLNVIVDATTDTQRLAINALGEAQVDVGAHSITNANALPVSKNNVANSSTNPLFVQNVVESVITGEVHVFNQGVAVATTSNHDYTVVNTMLVKSVIVSASGAMKAEIQVGAVLSLVSKAVIFTNADGHGQINFDPPIEVPNTGTGTVRVIRTNREGGAQDLYSTIIGIDA